MKISNLIYVSRWLRFTIGGANPLLIGRQLVLSLALLTLFPLLGTAARGQTTPPQTSGGSAQANEKVLQTENSDVNDGRTGMEKISKALKRTPSKLWKEITAFSSRTFKGSRNEKLPDTSLKFEATIIQIGDRPRVSCGVVAVYQLAKYRVDRVVEGNYKESEIIVDHLACKQDGLEGLSPGDKVVVVTTRGSVLQRWNATGIRNENDKVTTFYIGEGVVRFARTANNKHETKKRDRSKFVASNRDGMKSEVQTKITHCNFSLAPTWRVANLSFSSLYSFAVNNKGEVSDVRKVRDDFIGEDTVRRCITKWTIAGFPENSRFSVAFFWNHERGWVRQEILGNGFEKIMTSKDSGGERLLITKDERRP